MHNFVEIRKNIYIENRFALEPPVVNFQTLDTS